MTVIAEVGISVPRAVSVDNDGVEEDIALSSPIVGTLKPMGPISICIVYCKFFSCRNEKKKRSVCAFRIGIPSIPTNMKNVWSNMVGGISSLFTQERCKLFL